MQDWLPIAKSLAEHAPVVFTIVAGLIVICVGVTAWIVRLFVRYIQQSETARLAQEKSELEHRRNVSESCHEFQRELTERVTKAIDANTKVVGRAEQIMEQFDPPPRVKT